MAGGGPAEPAAAAGPATISPSQRAQSVLVAAALDGLGPTLLADWLVMEDIQTGSLVDVFPDMECTATEFDTPAWVLYPSRTYLPRKVRVPIDFLRAALKPTS